LTNVRYLSVSDVINVGLSFDIVANCEEPFYSSLGFSHNKGHLPYCIDERPYVR